MSAPAPAEAEELSAPECIVCYIAYSTRAEPPPAGEADHRPRTFTCGHTICSSCISSLVQKKCPECKQSFEAVPQVNYALMESMRQTQALRARIEAQQNVPAAAASTTPMCIEHTKKELDVWCHTCKILLCEYCLRFGSHKSLADHRTDLLTDAAAALREELRVRFTHGMPPSRSTESHAAFNTAAKSAMITIMASSNRIAASNHTTRDQLLQAIVDKRQLVSQSGSQIGQLRREFDSAQSAALDPSVSDYDLLRSSPTATLQQKYDQLRAVEAPNQSELLADIQRTAHAAFSQLIADIQAIRDTNFSAFDSPRVPNRRLESDRAESARRAAVEDHLRDPLVDPTLISGHGHTLRLDDFCDCLDTGKRWCLGQIASVEGTRVLVHYLNWSDKWDEWLERSDRRLQPVHTKTEGYNGPASKRHSECPIAEERNRSPKRQRRGDRRSV